VWERLYSSTPEKEKHPLVYEAEEMYVVYHAAYDLVQDSVQRLPILDKML